MNLDDLEDEINDSPRARLLQALEEVDDMLSVLIIYEIRQKGHLEAEYGYRTGLREGVGAASFLGLADWARGMIKQAMVGDDH